MPDENDYGVSADAQRWKGFKERSWVEKRDHCIVCLGRVDAGGLCSYGCIHDGDRDRNMETMRQMSFAITERLLGEDERADA